MPTIVEMSIFALTAGTLNCLDTGSGKEHHDITMTSHGMLGYGL